ncbi:acyl-CoA dehydrogenase [Noviherbaspirillum sedimenti]|nr:acyl-CoA dehydrogenase [Noviherbaspirillum sedimenti]
MYKFVTDEHRMIGETARRLFSDLVAEDSAEIQHGMGRINSMQVGRALVDLGIFPSSADDSSMASALVQSLVALEAGAACLPFPVLENLVASAVRVQSSTPSIASSEVFFTLPGSDCDGHERLVMENGRLSGSARLVPYVDLATRTFAVAKQGNNTVLVEVNMVGNDIGRAQRRTVEIDYPVQDIIFKNSVGSVLAANTDSNTSLVKLFEQRSSLLAAAEIAGACRRMVGMTKEYLLTRTQFGQVLGANQALKHALSDCHVSVEALVASIEYAAAAIDAEDVDGEAAVCASKHFATTVGKSVAECALQLHGAIGYTMEFPLHRLMRRVYRLGVSHGSRPKQVNRLFDTFQRCA